MSCHFPVDSPPIGMRDWSLASKLHFYGIQMVSGPDFYAVIAPRLIVIRRVLGCFNSFTAIIRPLSPV